MHSGLKFLPFYPRIYFTIEDWDAITSNGKVTDGNNLLALEPFIAVIDQLHQQYLRKRLTSELRRQRHQAGL
jgi:hypothetical protein